MNCYICNAPTGLLNSQFVHFRGRLVRVCLGFCTNRIARFS